METANTFSPIVEEIEAKDYEKIFYITEKLSGLKAIICVHSSTLGPPLGGIRIYPYMSFEDALIDVKRLAKGMTYKAALSETGLGGAKSVIITDPKHKTKNMLIAFAEAINLLEGLYTCAEDVNCSVSDLDLIAKYTKYVVGLSNEKSSGDPSVFTAWGTFRGIQAVLQALHGSTSLRGKKIAIQGLGNVGMKLAEFLFWHGAELIVSDLDLTKAEKLEKKYGAKICSPETIITEDCDIFSPCAMGGIINSQTISRLQCKAIAGCANNQLFIDQNADELKKRGILYAPDFVINAGGLINVSHELDQEGYNPLAARKKTDQIYDHLMRLFQISEQNQCSTHKAALDLAEYRIRYGIGKRIDSVFYHHSLQT